VDWTSSYIDLLLYYILIDLLGFTGKQEINLWYLIARNKCNIIILASRDDVICLPEIRSPHYSRGFRNWSWGLPVTCNSLVQCPASFLDYPRLYDRIEIVFSDSRGFHAAARGKSMGEVYVQRLQWRPILLVLRHEWRIHVPHVSAHVHARI